MQTLRCTNFFSSLLPSGDVATLFTGNERAFDDADAAYLLAEFPDRFEVSADAKPVSADAPPATPMPAPTPDQTLITKVTDVPEEIEKFGAEGARLLKAKKEKGAK